MKWTVTWITTALIVYVTAETLTVENIIDQINVPRSEEITNQHSTEVSRENNAHAITDPDTSNDANGTNQSDPPSNENNPDSSSVGDTAETDSDNVYASSTTPEPCDSSESSVRESEEAITADSIVETTSGPVRGHTWERNENIITYIDIPYGIFAKAFESPVIAEGKDTIHDVKEHSKRCPQLDTELYVGERDCLTLSIFKPANSEYAPVLFHIHDGNFTTGSGDPAIYGPDYLVPKGIILVLPNYRLGALGFLCMGNETAPGNAGLKDLTLALHWVQKNIAAFGGDPSNIIVSGDGSSGALAGYLSLSPKSKDYISKVIIESGSVLSHWAFDRTPVIAATLLAEKLRIFENLEEVPPSNIVAAAKDIVFKPCLEQNENGFMTETPWTMIHHKDNKIHFLIGTATYAGIYEALEKTTESLEELNEDPSLLLPNDLRFDTDTDRTEVGKKVKTQYFGDNIEAKHVKELSLFFTDAAYLGPGLRAARSLVESGATVYFYEFAFVGDFNRDLESLQHPVDGAIKGDIKGYLFTQDGIVPAENTDEHHMTELLTDMWSSFASTGSPSTDDVVWNKLTKTDQLEEEWLSITKSPEMKTGIHVDRLKLWTDVYDNYYIERSSTPGLSPGVYTVLVLQLFFWIGFFVNASHLY